MTVDLLGPIGVIAREALNATAEAQGSPLRFKSGQPVVGEAEYRIPVWPVRPVKRLSAIYELIAEAEGRIAAEYPGLRVLLTPEAEAPAVRRVKMKGEVRSTLRRKTPKAKARGAA